MLRARTNNDRGASCYRALIAAILMAPRIERQDAEAVAEEPTAYIVRSERCHRPQDRRSRGHARDPQGSRRLSNSPTLHQRVIQLSSYDDGVVFERKMVPAQLQEGALVFEVGLQATKPGRHRINGIFRVGLHP